MGHIKAAGAVGGNRLGQLYHCPHHRQWFEVRKAFPQTLAATA
jgi:hypothetical protein